MWNSEGFVGLNHEGRNFTTIGDQNRGTLKNVQLFRNYYFLNNINRFSEMKNYSYSVIRRQLKWSQFVASRPLSGAMSVARGTFMTFT